MSNSARPDSATALARSPLFSHLGRLALARLAGELEECHYKPGETIVRQGDRPDGFYVIKHGRAAVRAGARAPASDGDGTGEPLTTLGPGEVCEVKIGVDTSVTASEPVLVGHYLESAIWQDFGGDVVGEGDPDLSIAGHAHARQLSVQGVRADRLALRIDAAHVPSHPTGSGHLEVDNVERGNVKLGRLTIDASRRRDGKLQVALRSEPKPSPWRVDVDALVTTGETVVVELQRHLVRTRGGATWTGEGGRVSIGPICPVEREDEPCPVPPAVYAGVDVLVLEEPGDDLIARIDLDDEGRYRLDNVPPGTYTVIAWNESAPSESRRVVVPDAGGDVETNFALGRR